MITLVTLQLLRKTRRESMLQKVRFQKEEIISAAVEITREKEIPGLIDGSFD